MSSFDINKNNTVSTCAYLETMKIYIKYLILISVLTSSLLVSAQEYTLMQTVGTPQGMFINPAFRSTGGTFLSVPVVGSFDIGLDNSFRYNSVFVSKNGKNYLDNEKLLRVSEGSNLLMTRANIDIVNVGFRLAAKHYMSVSLRTRLHVATSYPGDLFAVILGNPIDNRTTYDISMSPNMQGWAELGVSYTYSPNRQWSFGVRPKYLNGAVSVRSNNVQITAEKQFDKYVISANKFTVNGGNFDFANTTSRGDEMLNQIGSNPGFGVDFGAAYVAEDHRWKGAASVSDLGVIFWNKRNSSQMTVRNPGAKFEFLGASDLGSFASGGADLGKVLDSAYNALTSTIGMDTISGVGFTTWLPTTFRVGFEYAIDQNLRHNITLNAVGTLPYKNKLHYGVSAGYAYRSRNDKWQLMTSYTYKNNDPLNIGLGVVFSSGCFQALLMTDDMIAVCSPTSSQSMGVRFGVNFFMGKHRKD